MKKFSYVLAVSAMSILTACGGGSDDVTQNPLPSETTPSAEPFKVADFSLGKLEVTGDTVLKPNFSNIGGTRCFFVGTLLEIQAALTPLSSQDLWNCPQLNTPGVKFLGGGSGVSPQDIAYSQELNLQNSPVRTSGIATAGQLFSIENFGIGDNLSTLEMGQASAISNNYRWSNFPSSSTGTTTLTFSYAKTADSLPSSLQALVQHKLSVSITVYWYDQFNQTQGKTFPIIVQNFDGDFTKSITFSINPADYPVSQKIAGLQLATDITSLTIIGRIQ